MINLQLCQLRYVSVASNSCRRINFILMVFSGVGVSLADLAHGFDDS